MPQITTEDALSILNDIREWMFLDEDEYGEFWNPERVIPAEAFVEYVTGLLQHNFVLPSRFDSVSAKIVLKPQERS